MYYTDRTSVLAPQNISTPRVARLLTRPDPLTLNFFRPDPTRPYLVDFKVIELLNDSRERMSVTVLPTDEKCFSDCAELAVMQNSLLAVRDMIG